MASGFETGDVSTGTQQHHDEEVGSTSSRKKSQVVVLEQEEYERLRKERDEWKSKCIEQQEIQEEDVEEFQSLMGFLQREFQQAPNKKSSVPPKKSRRETILVDPNELERIRQERDEWKSKCMEQQEMQEEDVEELQCLMETLQREFQSPASFPPNQNRVTRAASLNQQRNNKEQQQQQQQQRSKSLHVKSRPSSSSKAFAAAPCASFSSVGSSSRHASSPPNDKGAGIVDTTTSYSENDGDDLESMSTTMHTYQSSMEELEAENLRLRTMLLQNVKAGKTTQSIPEICPEMASQHDGDHLLEEARCASTTNKSSPSSLLLLLPQDLEKDRLRWQEKRQSHIQACQALQRETQTLHTRRRSMIRTTHHDSHHEEEEKCTLLALQVETLEETLERLTAHETSQEARIQLLESSLQHATQRVLSLEAASKAQQQQQARHQEQMLSQETHIIQGLEQQQRQSNVAQETLILKKEEQARADAWQSLQNESQRQRETELKNRIRQLEGTNQDWQRKYQTVVAERNHNDLQQQQQQQEPKDAFKSLKKNQSQQQATLPSRVEESEQTLQDWQDKYQSVVVERNELKQQLLDAAQSKHKPIQDQQRKFSSSQQQKQHSEVSQIDQLSSMNQSLQNNLQSFRDRLRNLNERL